MKAIQMSLATLVATFAMTATQTSLAADVVNPQITDSVTQANTKVLGDAPAVATGNLMIETSQALSNAAHNAASAQQNANTSLQAATTQGVSTLYQSDTALSGKSTKDVLK